MRINFILSIFFIGAVLLILEGCNNNLNTRSIKLYDANNNQIIDSELTRSENSLTINREYQQGDMIRVEGAKYLFVQLDENIPGSFVYAPKGVFLFPIPFQQ